MIQELDLVALMTDRSALGLRRGDVGTVVHIYGSDDLYEVEFINAEGDTVAVETLALDEVRTVDLGRVMNAALQRSGKRRLRLTFNHMTTYRMTIS